LKGGTIMAKAAPKAGAYDTSDLTVLEGLDAVRKRPGMYIGSTDSAGLHHLVYEIVDNSVDEALAGFCTTISVTLHADGSVEVADDGRGIPVDKDPRTGLTGVELVMTKLHAGGKFGGSGYAASGGLHGVGASVVNALSARVDVEVMRSGSRHALSFCRGETGSFATKAGSEPSPEDTFTATGGLRKVGKAEGTGTRVRFWADTHIFLPGSHLDTAVLCDRLRTTAFLVSGLTVSVTDLRTEGTPGARPGTTTFRFDGGVVDFVEHASTGTPLHEVLRFTGTGDYTENVPVLRDGRLVTEEVSRQMAVEVALQWSDTYEPNVRSFCNIISTTKGGSHVTGFERALVKVLNEQLRTTRTLRANEDNITKEDALEGLTAVVLVRIAEPQFQSQTKEILGTPAATKIVAQVVGDALEAVLIDPRKKNMSKAVLGKVAQSMRARIAARTQRETVRRKAALESASMPAKLADCRSTDAERTELIICEGDSAMGTLRAARNSEFQALLPIRGKILNVERATEKTMLANTECAAIITAMGAGAGKSFDLSQVRYGRFVIATDADVDGQHIRTLLLTLCWRYMRPLLEEGRVYAAMPPLYKVEVSGGRESRYCATDAEKDEFVAELTAAGKQVKTIKRFKGLGEMGAAEMDETTLSPVTRSLRRVTVADAKAADDVFSMLMGTDVPARRDFIVSHSSLLSPDMLDV
jgi:DNA gyrase subunit B